MQQTTTAHTLIVDSPAFIKAWMREEDGVSWLTVYRSVLVHDDDLPQEVKWLLNNHPHRVVVAEVVEDDDMVFGEGLLSVYRFTD